MVCLPARICVTGPPWGLGQPLSPSVSLHLWPPGPSLSLLGKEFMAVASQLSSRVFSAPPPCGSLVEGAQSHRELGVSQAAKGDPPRIWPLVCAVRSSLRNFSRAVLQKTHVCLWSAAASGCLTFAEFQQFLISFRKQNESAEKDE